MSPEIPPQRDEIARILTPAIVVLGVTVFFCWLFDIMVSKAILQVLGSITIVFAVVSLLFSNLKLRRENLKRNQYELDLLERNEALSQVNEPIVFADEQGRFKYVNAAFTTLFEYSLEELYGKPIAILTPTEDVTLTTQETSEIAASKGTFKGEVLRQAKNGRLVPILLNVSPVINAAGKPRGFIGVMVDMTEIKRTEEKLRLSATVLEKSSNAVIITDPNNRIISVNPAFTTITGYSHDEVIGKNPNILSSGAHPKEFYQQLWSTLYSVGSWTGEIVNRRKSGEVYVEWLSIKLLRDEGGKVTHHVAICSDITERKATENHLEQLAHYDFLTGLPNRTLFTDRLQQAIAVAKREKSCLALMYLDLDKFKPVNDQHGHHAGDLLLKEAAKRMQECVRESDTVSRVGGDEFVVLLPVVTGKLDAITVADKILLALYKPFEIDGRHLEISSSIGIAFYPEHGSDEKQLLGAADKAMYQAKENGRNNVQIAHQEIVVG